MLSSHRRDRSFRDSFSGRVSKSGSKKKGSSFKDASGKRMSSSFNVTTEQPTPPNLNSPIVTITVGSSQRLFAAHQETLSKSPYFANLCKYQFFETNRRIGLPDEEPEVFSAVLEFLYKGDYAPRLAMDKKRHTWYLEDDGKGSSENTVFHHRIGAHILKDTAIYCAAEKFGLPELKRIALKKQGLQSGVQCSTILTSARYAYAYTPDSDSRLRAHYLALIIRSRNTFKRSGTMQEEMTRGGKWIFDLFVAMTNHMDDIKHGH